MTMTFRTNGLRAQLLDLLAAQLLAAPAYRCPGVEGATIEDIVDSQYPQAIARGFVPGPAVLTARFPLLADAIREFFQR
jgi:hypothetical protein